MKCIIFLLLSISVFAQSSVESNCDTAYQNAKKGIYWGFDNIPQSKGSLSKDLIIEDKLVASVKLSKEIEGVKVESTGYFETYEVTVTLYKSFDSLRKEGYL